MFQKTRVSVARVYNEAQAQALEKFIESSIERRQFGALGEERINVLLLNIALDKMR
jgi:K+-transporting ATPase c subunit